MLKKLIIIALISYGCNVNASSAKRIYWYGDGRAIEIEHLPEYLKLVEKDSYIILYDDGMVSLYIEIQNNNSDYYKCGLDLVFNFTFYSASNSSICTQATKPFELYETEIFNCEFEIDKEKITKIKSFKITIDVKEHKRISTPWSFKSILPTSSWGGGAIGLVAIILIYCMIRMPKILKSLSRK